MRAMNSPTSREWSYTVKFAPIFKIKEIIPDFFEKIKSFYPFYEERSMGNDPITKITDELAKKMGFSVKEICHTFVSKASDSRISLSSNHLSLSTFNPPRTAEFFRLLDILKELYDFGFVESLFLNTQDLFLRSQYEGTYKEGVTWTDIIHPEFCSVLHNLFSPNLTKMANKAEYDLGSDRSLILKNSFVEAKDEERQHIEIGYLLDLEFCKYKPQDIATMKNDMDFFIQKYYEIWRWAIVPYSENDTYIKEKYPDHS